MGIFEFFNRFAAQDPVKKHLQNVARNEIRISYSSFNGIASDTCSKFGGKPAVPNDFVWPQYAGKRFRNEDRVMRPLSFLAQINLADVAEYDTENLLPKTGMLSFFYEMVSMEWGMLADDRDFVKVYYFPDVDLLSLRDIPEEMEEEGFIPELEMHFEKQISLPYPDNFYDEDFDWSEYENCCNELGYEFDELGGRTKLLGYPDVIQEPMEEECETVSRGYTYWNPKDSEKASEAEKLDIKLKSKEWILLFQMGTIVKDETEIMFGDCGHIYFWIRKEDLKNRNFNHIGFVLQCG